MASTKLNGKPINETKDKLGNGSLTKRYHVNEQGIVVEKPTIILPDSLKAETEKNEFFKKAKEEGINSRNEISNYNDTLLETANPILKNMELIGPKLLVRLFKLQMYSPDLLYIGGRRITVMTRSELDKKSVEGPPEIQFQERGVVVAISNNCSDNIKNQIKVGDIVDIDPNSNIAKLQRYLNKELINETFDNYFLIHESAVEFVTKK